MYRQDAMHHMHGDRPSEIAIVGGGYTGLSAAYDLARAGCKVTVFEREAQLGGLAGVFEILPGIELEKFYHHWFSSDVAVLDWFRELGVGDLLETKPTNTGLYFANSIFRLSSPLDLLRFTPLPLFDRVRTGLMALAARSIHDYRKLEGISAHDWIRRYAGERSYEVIWKPLLRGKFGRYADDVSAVWFWNKLKLRGSSRNKAGGEQLFYIRGGFAKGLAVIESSLAQAGVRIEKNATVERVVIESGAAASGNGVSDSRVSGNRVRGVQVAGRERRFDQVLMTAPAPMCADLCPELPGEILNQLRTITFLGNVCLVLVLNRPLSSTYWLNVADPDFPFVGVIEHTNFDPPERYAGKHIAFLSKYLPVDEQMFTFDRDQMLAFAMPHLKRMFPAFQESWVQAHFLWKERYSQPLVTKYYSRLIPPMQLPIEGLWLSTMAQIYPEDRGTNYAVARGRQVAQMMMKRS